MSPRERDGMTDLTPAELDRIEAEVNVKRNLCLIRDDNGNVREVWIADLLALARRAVEAESEVKRLEAAYSLAVQKV